MMLRMDGSGFGCQVNTPGAARFRRDASLTANCHRR